MSSSPRRTQLPSLSGIIIRANKMDCGEFGGGGTTIKSQNSNHDLSTHSLLQDIFLSACWVQPCIKHHVDASCELGSQIK